jgi:hypothetical protein
LSAPTQVSRVADPRLQLSLNPSLWLWRYELGLHGIMALLIVWVLWPWGLAARILSALLVMGLIIHLIYRAKRRDKATGQLSYSGGRWSWQSGSLTEILIPAGDFLVWPWLVILPFRTERRARLTLVLLLDSANADDLRRLRVLLLSRAGFSRN